jgi:hypothetical protein
MKITMKPTLVLLQPLYSHPLFKEIVISRASGKYVVQDPLSPIRLLYLTEKTYQRIVAIALSNDATLTVLLEPGETIAVGPNDRPLVPPASDDSSGSKSGGFGITPTPFIMIPEVTEEVDLSEWTTKPTVTLDPLPLPLHGRGGTGSSILEDPVKEPKAVDPLDPVSPSEFMLKKDFPSPTEPDETGDLPTSVSEVEKVDLPEPSARLRLEDGLIRRSGPHKSGSGQILNGISP